MVKFLRWLLVVSLAFVGGYMAYSCGLFTEIYNKDVTYLSFVIFSLFVLTSLMCGFYSLREKPFECGWFVSEQLLSLGMVGTVIGFIMMLSSLGNINIGDVQSMQHMMTQLSVGASTALYTTLSGLVCGILLKVQCFNLES